MRKLILVGTLLLVASPAAHSQAFSFGVKVGVPLTNTYINEFVADGAGSSSEQRFTFGPTAEVHFPFHLSFEVDALWRQSSLYQNGANIQLVNASVHDWQVPLLAKYELHFGPVRPFLDGGVVYRHVSATSGAAPNNPNSSGVSLGGGVTLKLGPFRLSPEVRYTRWPSPPAYNISSAQSTANQADLLVGLTF